MLADKRCRKCGVVKPLDAFYRDAAGRDGHRPECKECTAARRKRWYTENKDREIARVADWQRRNAERHRAYQQERRQQPAVKRKNREGHLRRKYGITLADYDALLKHQEGVCAICGREPRDDIALHVDHDHATGAVRGLLCFRCNNAVGDLGDDPVILQRAADYLSPVDSDLVERARRRARALVTVR